VTSFGNTNGVWKTSFPFNVVTGFAKDTVPYSISIDSSNMYVAGYGTYNEFYDEQWRIEKHNLNTGLPVTSFGSEGAVLVPATFALWSEAFAIAMDDSHFYTGGFDELTAVVSETWRIEKRLK